MLPVEQMYEDMQPLLKTGRPEETLQALRNTVRSFPDLARAHNDLGMLYYQTGDRQKALGHFERAAVIAPGNPVFLKSLADFYHVDMARAEDAAKLYSKIVELRPNEVPILLTTANLLVSLKRFDDAATLFRKVLNIEPWNTEANDTLQQLQRIRIGSNHKSIPVEMHAGAQKPINQNNATAAQPPQDLYNEATRLISAGDTASGSDRLLHLVTFYPEFALAHNDLGVLAYQIGKKQEALERYQKAAQMEPSNMTFQKNLADCYWVGFGRSEDALKIYVDILSAYPKDLETLLATGKLCLALHRPEDARVFFERMLEIEPWNAAANQELEQLEAAVKAA